MSSKRRDGRALDELRPLSLQLDFTDNPPWLGPLQHGTHEGAVHRVSRERRAAVDARFGEWLDHSGVFDAASVYWISHDTGGLPRPAFGADAGDSTADRTIDALRR